jgi:hypothetical protein
MDGGMEKEKFLRENFLTTRIKQGAFLPRILTPQWNM